MAYDPVAFRREIEDACDRIVEVLVEKNRKCGDSALRGASFAPASILCKARLLDKFRRVDSGQPDDEEAQAVWDDIFGYSVLLAVALEREAPKVKVPAHVRDAPDPHATLMMRTHPDPSAVHDVLGPLPEEE